MTTYLYRPPTYKYKAVLVGSLTCYIDTCTTVYRIGGIWTNTVSPGMSSPSPADCDIESTTGLLCYFNTPTVVPSTLVAGLTALAPADSSWTSGTLTAL